MDPVLELALKSAGVAVSVIDTGELYPAADPRRRLAHWGTLTAAAPGKG
jgi:hypothetical protein